jgi:hypothetical protein
MAQITMPTSQRRRPRPSAPASVPFMMARARSAAEQDRLAERPVDRHGETRHVFGRPRHQTSAPPPNEKNDRKKLDAAKAIDRPNTIWIRRRKPPDVAAEGQRQAGVMMMMTATILATGPSID